jgi:peptidoglycan biosynthesis protein MviN/MurJ (putative lipid II flippase)
MPIRKSNPLDAPDRPFRSGLALSTITVAQIVTAFGIQWYTVAQLGAGSEMDALYAGATLPQIMMIVVAEQLGFVLTPMLAVKSETDRRIAGCLLFWVVFGISSLLVLFLMLVTPVATPLLAPGFSEPTMRLTFDLTMIQAMGVVGAGCTMVLTSIYHAGNNFIRPAVSVLMWLFIGWCVLVMGLQYGKVTLAAWVQVLCFTGPMLSLFPAIARWPLYDRSAFGGILSEAWRRLKPLMMNAAYYRTGFIVDRLLTSFLAPGGLVILELVWRIHTALVRILNQGITTPALPLLATLSSRESWPAFQQRYLERLGWIVLFSLGTVMGVVAMALVGPRFYDSFGENPVIGTLRSQDLDRLLFALVAGSGVLLFGSTNHLLASAFYAQGDTRTPTRIQMLVYSIGIVLKSGGFFFGGLLGILAAISLYYALEAVLLGTALNRRLRLRLRVETRPSLGLPVAED